MRFVFWDTRFCQNLKGGGACDLSFGIRISSKLLRGTGLCDLSLGIRISSKLLGGRGLRFVFWDTNFFQTLKGDGACDLSNLKGDGALRFVFWDTRFCQNLKGDGACDLSFGIRISSKLLRGTGLAICLLGYLFLPNS